MRRLLLASSFFVLLAAGCSSKSSPTAGPCDPLAASSTSRGNFPRKVWTISDVSDGSVLVLTLSSDEYEGTDGTDVFYGPPSHLQQAAIDNLSQSGTGDVYVMFTLASGQYGAHIGNGVKPDPSYPAPAFDTMDAPGGTLTLKERADTSLAGMAFVCN